ncbi:hypothetical protein Tco_0360932 [Tanacetum coccineum]
MRLSRGGWPENGGVRGDGSGVNMVMVAAAVGGGHGGEAAVVMMEMTSGGGGYEVEGGDVDDGGVVWCRFVVDRWRHLSFLFILVVRRKFGPGNEKVDGTDGGGGPNNSPEKEKDGRGWRRNVDVCIDNLTQELLVGPAFNLLKGTCKSFVELEYHFEECYKAVTNQLDWNNPEGHEYPFNLNKPLSLIEAQGRQVVPADYFLYNDLEYLKGGSSSKKYTTSTTKTKAAKYDILKASKTWFRCYGVHNKESKHDVFSKKRIFAVTHVKVMKWYDYGYLEEIII